MIPGFRLRGGALRLACVTFLAAAVPGSMGIGHAQEGAPREQAFKMVEAYFISNIQESLGLSDEQFVKLLPSIKKLQTSRREFLQRRQRSLAELRQMLRSGTATESKLAEQLAELRRIELDEPAAIRHERETIERQLTVVQQAKFRVLEVEVEQRVREAIGRQLRPEGRPRRQSQPRR